MSDEAEPPFLQHFSPREQDALHRISADGQCSCGAMVVTVNCELCNDGTCAICVDFKTMMETVAPGIDPKRPFVVHNRVNFDEL